MEKINFCPLLILIIYFIRFLLSRDKRKEHIDCESQQGKEKVHDFRKRYEEEYTNEFENEEEPLHTDETETTAEGLFAKCRTIEEVKKRFRRLSMLNHPDRGGSAAAMKEILAQYDEALKLLSRNK